MKHFKLKFCIIASLCITSMSAYVYAQPNHESQYEALSPENQFFRDGMKWELRLNDDLFIYASATVIGDSILKISNASAENGVGMNEVACKALEVKDASHPKNSPALYAVRESQNRIEVWNSDKEQFVCIMDFGIEEGEDINGMTVTKIDHVKVGPELRRRITLTENGSVRRWIYGIGADEFTPEFYDGDASRVYKMAFFEDNDNRFFNRSLFRSSPAEAENKFYCDGKQWEVITEWPGMDLEPQTRTVTVGEEAEIDGVRCRKIGDQYVCDTGRRTYRWIEGLKRWALEMDFNLNESVGNPKYGLPVLKVDYILINGESHKRIAFAGDDGQSTYWVEGVGASDDNFICNSIIDKPTDGSRRRMLSCSQDNEVIFTYPEFSSATGIPRTYVPTVREDRVWCYWGQRGPMYDDLLHYIHFPGTVEVGGKTYHKGILFKTVKYDYVVDQNAYTVAEETERSITMYYLREEEGKVYQLQHSDDTGYPYRVTGSLPENLNPDDYCEGILYDWTLAEGDVFVPEIWWKDTGGYSEESVVEYGDEITIDGETCRVMGFGPFWVNAYPVIEGIGCTYNGTVGHYYPYFIAGGGGSNSVPEEDSRLQCVYNGEGKLIYGEEVKLADGVNDIITDKTDDAEPPVYDLMGRRVTNPLPGSVYIRDGRKFVGK